LEQDSNIPVESSKLYYSISEVAAMFGVNASLIRFWEKEFDIIKPRKNAKGNRLFTQQDIDIFALIHHFVKERRMTLEGARQKIKENRDDAEHNFKIVKSLKKVRAMLLELKDNIDESLTPQPPLQRRGGDVLFSDGTDDRRASLSYGEETG
jgi:DNA-binding transcriptional MerR regulator